MASTASEAYFEECSFGKWQSNLLLRYSSWADEALLQQIIP
jgi:hypothetical protein